MTASTKKKTIDENPKTPGQMLKDLREKQNLSQGAVAKAFGWAKGTFVSNWENGHSPLPLRYVPKLAKLYRVSTLVIRQILAREEIKEVKHKYGLEENK